MSVNRNTLSEGRIYWSCRRGMLELDLILIPFYQTIYQTLTEAERASFIDLLTYQDPDIHAWLGGRSLPTDNRLHPIIQRLRDYSLNATRSRSL